MYNLGVHDATQRNTSVYPGVYPKKTVQRDET